MDINALAKTIAAIIKADGSATVPGLGKFSVAKSSAKLSDDGTIIYPPKIELDFVQDYEEAGIDTIERYASQTGKERECAANEIKECVGEIKRQLIENGTVVMPQMGEITLDKENRPSFKMAERCILAAELFGLEPVALRPKAGFSKDKVILQQEKPEAREENKPQEQQKSTPETTQKKMTKAQAIAIYIIAAIIIIAILLFVFRQQLSPLIEKLLYTKEELELMEQLNL